MHTLRMGLRVGQRQGRAPRATKQHPFIDAQVLANPLKIGDQIPGGVVSRLAWGGTTATALIEGDDSVQVRIKSSDSVHHTRHQGRRG